MKYLQVNEQEKSQCGAFFLQQDRTMMPVQE
jgi:hypothetical protein